MDIKQLEARRRRMIFTTKAGTQGENTSQQLQRLEEMFFIQEGTIEFPKHPNEKSISQTLMGFRFEEKSEENWNGKAHEKIKLKTVFTYQDKQVLMEQQFCLDRLEYAFYLDGIPTKEEELMDRLFIKLMCEINMEILNIYLRQTLTQQARHRLWKKIYSENFLFEHSRKMITALGIEKTEAIEIQENAVNVIVEMDLKEGKEKVKIVNEIFSGYLNTRVISVEEKEDIHQKLASLLQQKDLEFRTPTYDADGLMVWSKKIFGPVVYSLLQEFQETKQYELKKKFDPRMENRIEEVMKKIKTSKKN